MIKINRVNQRRIKAMLASFAIMAGSFTGCISKSNEKGIIDISNNESIVSLIDNNKSNYSIVDNSESSNDSINKINNTNDKYINDRLSSLNRYLEDFSLFDKEELSDADNKAIDAFLKCCSDDYCFNIGSLNSKLLREYFFAPYISYQKEHNKELFGSDTCKIAPLEIILKFGNCSITIDNSEGNTYFGIGEEKKFENLRIFTTMSSYTDSESLSFNIIGNDTDPNNIFIKYDSSSDEIEFYYNDKKIIVNGSSKENINLCNSLKEEIINNPYITSEELLKKYVEGIINITKKQITEINCNKQNEKKDTPKIHLDNISIPVSISQPSINKWIESYKQNLNNNDNPLEYYFENFSLFEKNTVSLEDKDLFVKEITEAYIAAGYDINKNPDSYEKMLDILYEVAPYILNHENYNYSFIADNQIIFTLNNNDISLQFGDDYYQIFETEYYEKYAVNSIINNECITYEIRNNCATDEPSITIEAHKNNELGIITIRIEDEFSKSVELSKKEFEGVFKDIKGQDSIIEFIKNSNTLINLFGDELVECINNSANIKSLK